ncbi:MAG: hypothetical protein Q8P41_25830 [Pseudomonadota bacterium]|nr:hypothetical protein [Pseudomonadota bacterium]
MLSLSLVALLSSSSPAHADDQEGVWESRKKEGGGQVLADIVVDPGDPSRWFALSAGNLYVSYKAGNGWRAIAFDIDGVRGDGSSAEHALLFDPASPGVLYARFKAGKARRSVDGGATWADDAARIEWVDGRWQVLHGVSWRPPEPARAYARDPSNTDIVYAATGTGVYASADAGKTWEARNAWLKDPDVMDLRVDPQNTQTLVALSAHNAYRSTNGGRMWTELSPDKVGGSERFTRILFDDGERLVARYGERGEIWVQSGTQWARKEVRCAAISPLSGTDAVCANAGTLLKGDLSVPAFEDALRTNFKQADVLRLRETPKGLVIATLDGGGALASTDGRAWTVYRGIEEGYVRDIAEEPTGTGVVFRAARGAWMWKSAAEGWISRIDDGTVSVVQFDAAAPMRVYAASGSGKMWRSDDLGWTFQASTGLPGSAIEDLVVDASGTGVLWAATWGDGVYRSPDAGKTWAPAGQAAGATYVRRLALDPVNPDTVWAAAVGAGLWRTSDAGASWQPMQTGCKVVHAVAVHPLQSENVAVGCEDGKVVRTADGGATWGEPTRVSKADVRSVLYTAANPTLVVGTASAEVIWAAEDGAMVKNDRFANMRIDEVSFMYSMQRGVIHGPEGMFLTTDSGKSWTPVGLTGKSVSSAMIAPDGIWAWVQGEGLQVWTDKGQRWERKPVPSVRASGIGKDDVACDAPLPLNAKVRIHSGEEGLLLAEPTADEIREWYGRPSSWSIRGHISCRSRTGEYAAHSLGLAGSRFGEWVTVARAIGLDLPLKLQKAAEERGLDIAENIQLEDGSVFFLTRGRQTGLWDGETFKKIGQLPPETVSYRLIVPSEGKPERVMIAIGTQHGVVISADFGKTFRTL